MENSDFRTNDYFHNGVKNPRITTVNLVCNQIRYLQLDNYPRIKHIGEGAELSNLEVISAAGSALNDEGLAMIGNRCSHQLKWNLEKCEGVTTESLRAMVKKCRSLRDLKLKKCPQVSVNSLNSLVFSYSSPRRVILSHVPLL